MQSVKHHLFSSNISESSILDYYRIQQGQHNNCQHYFVLKQLYFIMFNILHLIRYLHVYICINVYMYYNLDRW